MYESILGLTSSDFPSRNNQGRSSSQQAHASVCHKELSSDWCQDPPENRGGNNHLTLTLFRDWGEHREQQILWHWYKWTKPQTHSLLSAPHRQNLFSLDMGQSLTKHSLPEIVVTTLPHTCRLDPLTCRFSLGFSSESYHASQKS